MALRLLSVMLLLVSSSAFARGLTDETLVGEYTVTGNGGFLSYHLVFNHDGSENLAQQLPGDSPLECIGVYKIDVPTQVLTSVFNCPGGEVLSHEAFLASVTLRDLQVGARVNLRIKSSLGSDSTVVVKIKKVK